MTEHKDDIHPRRLVDELMNSISQTGCVELNPEVRNTISDKAAEFISAGAMLIGILSCHCSFCTNAAYLAISEIVKVWLDIGIAAAQASDAVISGDPLGCAEPADEVPS